MKRRGGTLLTLVALTACGGLFGHDDVDAGAVDATSEDSHAVPPPDVVVASDVADAGTGWSLAYHAEVDLTLPVSFIDSVQIGDVTNDGLADIVAATIGNGVRGIAVIAQRPDGTLADPVLYALANYGWVELGDVTGDGLTDVVGNPIGGVGVLPQSDGGFGTPAVYLAHDAGGGTAIPGQFGVALLRESAIDLFARDAGALVYAAEFAQPMYWNLLAVGDVTGDGLDDCVGATYYGGINGTISVMAQSGPLTLEQPKTYVYGYADAGFDFMPTGLAVGDVTGDGLSDVVVSYGGNKPNSHVTVLPQQGGALGAAVVYPSLDIPETVRLADMNGDGRLDVVVSHTGWAHVGIYLQQSNGTLGTEQLFPLDTFVGHGPCIAAGDINGDGHPDVVGISSKGANELALLLSTP